VHSYDEPSHVDWSQIYRIPKVIEKSLYPACIATDEFCGGQINSILISCNYGAQCTYTFSCVKITGE
jgi:hypothetical protein